MNGAQLKIFAILIMIIDHVGAVIFPGALYLRIIGRLAFPIFAFLIGEGLAHTRDPKKYALRLFAFALISEIPFDLCFYGKILSFDHQNIFFTLTLGVLSGILYRKYMIKSKNIGLLVVYLLALAAEFLRFDYGMFGIIMIFGIVQANSMKVKYAWIIGINILLGLLILMSNGGGWFQMFGGFSVLFLMQYNREKGKGIKYLFYGIYPFHLFLLYLLQRFLA